MKKLAAPFAFAAILAAGIADPVDTAHAVSVVNGSFELGTDPGGSFLTVNAGESSITGWTVDSGSVDYIGGYWAASDGLRSIDMNGLTTGSISQTITGLTIGQQYRVSFDLAGNTDFGPTVKTSRGDGER